METLAIVGRTALILSFLLLGAAGVLRLFPMRSDDASQTVNQWSHRAMWAGWILVTAATALLIGLFLADAFAFTYVSGRSNRAMPAVYKITALWAGQEGSLLLWLWIQSGYALIVSHRAMWGRALDKGAAGVLALISTFFALLVAFVASPFTLHANPPLDGVGMNPILQSYWMTAHPVMLYFGYVGLSVPFAYGAASLIHGSDAWIRATRRWSLVGWTFLSVGILFGARWAYEELGWGGYWGWDPVENASFMPWLVATAFIHSGLIQEKRGMLKRWNHVLIFTTYLLTIFGTFITRSGILASVHAFVESDISPWFVAFTGVLIAGYLYGLVQRWEALKDERSVDSPVSKESAFLANNVIFMATAFAIFWGTVFPLISSAMGRQVTVGAPYFDRVTAPMFWAMIILMGVGPLLAWRRATVDSLKRHFTAPVLNALIMLVWLWVVGVRETVTLLTLPAVVFVLTTILMEFARGVGVRMRSRGEPFWLALPRMMNRSPGRYGGYVVHLGILLMVVGIATSGVYQQERSVVLSVGETAEIGQYRLLLYDVRQTMHGAVPAVEADLLVHDASGPIGFIRPSKRFYPGSEAMGPSTEIAVYQTLRGDLYAVLAGWEPYGSLVGFKLYINPLIGLIWTGGALVVFGGVFAFWPRRRRALSEAEQALASLAELEYDYQMGKVSDAEYQALFDELYEKAEAYLQKEKEAAQRVISQLAKGIGAASLVLLLALGLVVPHGVAAQEAPLTPPAQGVMESAMGATVAVPDEVLVVSIQDGRLAVLNFVNVTHVGDEAAPEVRLAVPAQAVVQEVEPARVEPGDGGVLVDSLPMHPGETRRYTLRYELPVFRWPYALQKEILYPTRQLAILVPQEQLEAGAVDLIPVGFEQVAQSTFVVYQSEWIAPDTVWQAVLKPLPGAGVLLGWDPALEQLPVIAEPDRFPGDWLFIAFGRLPGWLRFLVVGVFAAGGVLLWRWRHRQGTRSAGLSVLPGTEAKANPAKANSVKGNPGTRTRGEDAATHDVDALVRTIARLDIAYSEGALPERGYQRRRAALLNEVRQAMERAEGGPQRALSRLQRRLVEGGQVEGGKATDGATD